MSLNPDPPKALHSWAVTYEGDPVKGSPSVMVSVWLPAEVGRTHITEIAGYLARELGWHVYPGSGWSASGGSLMPDGELMLVTVSVRAREIKSALRGLP
jgi:hypothetical protein